ncbi:YceI family protein [Fodinicola feengrottensis]|uniref:YceI family protein n=1 Tax=Fodinicola feengrottensis TaxID=435914 RepID=A0ABN2G9E8_9ACTN|nr:YceI family protein [Fodinicola feengrottensis]
MTTEPVEMRSHSQAGGVRATIQTSDGWAVSTAILTVTDSAGRQVGRAMADGDGVVATGRLDPGTYTAILTAPGFTPSAHTAMVTASGSAELGTLRLSRLPGADLPATGIWTIDPAHTSILVSARHMGLTSVSGRFTAFAGTIQIAEPLERSSVTAVIEADSIDTANKMRDDHMRSADFLAVDRFPTITYSGLGLTARGPEKWALSGDLTIKDVTKMVTLELTYLGLRVDPWGNTRLGVKALGELRRGDFSITYNQVLAAGIDAVGTTLRVEMDIQAVQGDTVPSL